MGQCIARLRVKSHPDTINFPVTSKQSLKNAWEFVSTGTGAMSGTTTSGNIFVVPASDVAHIFFINVPQDWMD